MLYYAYMVYGVVVRLSVRHNSLFYQNVILYTSTSSQPKQFKGLFSVMYIDGNLDLYNFYQRVSSLLCPCIRISLKRLPILVTERWAQS